MGWISGGKPAREAIVQGMFSRATYYVALQFLLSRALAYMGFGDGGHVRHNCPRPQTHDRHSRQGGCVGREAGGGICLYPLRTRPQRIARVGGHLQWARMRNL